jgi:cytoskeletal protein CcmA (bactofilin family)
MFEKKKDDGGADDASGHGNSDESAMGPPPLKPFSRKGSHAPSKPPAAATYRPEIPRRVLDVAPASRRIDPVRSGDGDSKRLTVGRDIHLKGEISSCDKLVVEGRVEAALSDARIIEVAPSGYFKGDAQVVEADISGHFEGKLIARDKLTVRSSGRITGSIRYGRIVIESGGEISGDMQSLGSEAEGDSTSDRDGDAPGDRRE